MIWFRIAIWRTEEVEEGHNTVFMPPYWEKKLPELHYSIEVNTTYAIYGNITYDRVWEIGEKSAWNDFSIYSTSNCYNSEEVCISQNAGSYVMTKFKLS